VLRPLSHSITASALTSSGAGKRFQVEAALRHYGLLLSSSEVEVLSWAHTRGLLLRRCASAKNIKAMAAAVPHAISKAASTTLIATPTHSLDGLEAEVIDSQEQSRDDADSNSALVLT
jgi:hypothetical protein